MTATEDPIERYLDELLLALTGRARDVRRILAETETHLRDATRAGVSAGLGETEAAEQAIARFGRPRDVARRLVGPGPPAALPSRPVLIQLGLSLLLLGTVGLLAIGASGVLAAGLGQAFGAGFVAGDAPGVTYTPARCAEYHEYEPGAGSCGQAAAAHHFGEVVANQLALGVLGLLSLVGYRWLRRRLARGRPVAVGLLPDGFVATIGASVFGVAAALFLLQAAGQLAASSGSATGAVLGQGLACLLVAALFLPALYRTLHLRAGLASAEPDHSH